MKEKGYNRDGKIYFEKKEIFSIECDKTLTIARRKILKRNRRTFWTRKWRVKRE